MILWTTPRNPHLPVYNPAIPVAACRRMWTTVENEGKTPTVPTSQNVRFPQVHNPYYNNEKNSASS